MKEGPSIFPSLAAFNEAYEGIVDAEMVGNKLVSTSVGADSRNLDRGEFSVSIFGAALIGAAAFSGSVCVVIFVSAEE